MQIIPITIYTILFLIALIPPLYERDDKTRLNQRF